MVNRDAKFRALSILSLLLVLSAAASAVNSRIVSHKTGEDFLKGRTDRAVIGSRGTIQLARKSEILAEKIEGAWSVSSVQMCGGTVYIGTSPNGGLYEYRLGQLHKIYTAEINPLPETDTPDANFPDANTPDANTPEAETCGDSEIMANEHIYALAQDISGRLLVGISGKKPRLCRLEADQLKTLKKLASRGLKEEVHHLPHVQEGTQPYHV